LIANFFDGRSLMYARLHCAVLLILLTKCFVAAPAQTNWTAVGPSAIQWPGIPAAAGKLNAIVVNNANTAVMYAAGGAGNQGPNTEAGIFKTVNGGTSWTHADVGLTDHVVDALWLDQANPKTLLAGTELTGIFRSTDGGGQWNPVKTGALGSTSAFLQVGTTLYAATAQGIASSPDNGATWSIIKNTAPAAAKAIVAGGSLIYVGLNNGQVLINSSGVWTSSSPSANPVSSIAINPSNAQYAFVAEWGNNPNPGVYVTQNAGATPWNLLNTSPCNGAVQVLAFDSNSTLYAGCNFSAWKSTSLGANWTPMPSASFDIRVIIPDFAGKPGNIAIGSDQGLFLSKDGGNTWQSLNGNIKSSILTGLAVHGSTILTAAQDFETVSSLNGGKSWTNGGSGALGEDGSVLFNPGNYKYAYFFTTSGFDYSTDGGKTFTFASQLPATEFPQYSGDGDLIAVDAKNPSTMYVAAVDGVFKSTDWGVDWTLQAAWPITAPVMVAVDPTNSTKIFVGQQNGTLMVSTNGGAPGSWSTSTLGCTNCGAPISAAVNPSNPLTVLIGMSAGPPNGGILVSSDGGMTFALADSGIAPGTYGCEAGAVPHIRFDPSGSGLVAAATNTGLYTSTNLGGTWPWSNISGNAIPQCFTDLVWSGKQLYVSTGGEGVLHMPWPN